MGNRIIYRRLWSLAQHSLLHLLLEVVIPSLKRSLRSERAAQRKELATECAAHRTNENEKLRVRDDELWKSENVIGVEHRILVLKIIIKRYGDFPPLVRAFALMLSSLFKKLLLRKLRKAFFEVWRNTQRSSKRYVSSNMGSVSCAWSKGLVIYYI